MSRPAPWDGWGGKWRKKRESMDCLGVRFCVCAWNHWSVAGLTREQQGSAGRWSQCDILWLFSVNVSSPDSQAVGKKIKEAISPLLNPLSLRLGHPPTMPPFTLHLLLLFHSLQIHLLSSNSLTLCPNPISSNSLSLPISVRFIQLSFFFQILFIPPSQFATPFSISLKSPLSFPLCFAIFLLPFLSSSLFFSAFCGQTAGSATVRVCLCNHTWLHTASHGREQGN